MKTNLFFLTLLLFSRLCLALPAEGFEAFGFKSAYSKSNLFNVLAGYVNPVWTSDYQTFQIYNSIPVLGTNYLSIGLSQTVANRFSDRSSYFVRYDQTFFNQSLSFKFTHIDENFIGSAKNIISTHYNGSFKLGKTTQIYTTLGMYYRFSLSTLNSPTWSPLNFNTEDREYFFEGVLGFLVPLGQKHFLTLDLNNRDTFNSFNTDFSAFDAALNLKLNQQWNFRIISSFRMSSFFMGTADLAQLSLLMGLSAEL